MRALVRVFTIFTSIAFAHGEEKPGPHGGHIRMPGAFHTEVIKEKEGYRIYLLDINWKNPSVLDSSVKAFIQFDKKKIDLSCMKESDSYLCENKTNETGKPEQKGELNVVAKREGQAGGVSSYKLPLQFEKSQNKMTEPSADQHKGH